VLQTAAIVANLGAYLGQAAGGAFAKPALHPGGVAERQPDPRLSRRGREGRSTPCPGRGPPSAAIRVLNGRQPAEGAFDQALDTQQVLGAVKPFVKG
jgi:hypothetical protein